MMIVWFKGFFTFGGSIPIGEQLASVIVDCACYTPVHHSIFILAIPCQQRKHNLIIIIGPMLTTSYIDVWIK